MTVITYVYTALQARFAELREDGERGDSPVPTAVIIMGLAVVAMAVTGFALAAATDWMDSIPGATNPTVPK